MTSALVEAEVQAVSIAHAVHDAMASGIAHGHLTTRVLVTPRSGAPHTFVTSMMPNKTLLQSLGCPYEPHTVSHYGIGPVY
jgi:hypothetical protein